MLRFFIRYSRGIKRYFLLLVILSVLYAGVNISVIWLTKKIIQYSLKLEKEAVLKIVVLFALTMGIGTGIYYLLNWVNTKFNAYFIKNIKLEMIKKMLSCRVDDIQQDSQAKIVTLFTNDLTNMENFCESIGKNLCIISTTVFSIIYLLKVSVVMFAICFLFLPLIMHIVNKISMILADDYEVYLNNIAESNAIFMDVVNGNETIRSFAMEKEMKRRYENAVEKAFQTKRNIEIKEKKILRYNIIITEGPGFLCIIFSIFGTVFKMINGVDLVAFYQLLRVTIDSVIQFPGCLMEMRKVRSNIRRIETFIAAEKERSDGEAFSLKRKFSISFENFSFGYNNQLVLKNINFRFETNKIYALIGKSGAGKTTLFDSILGFIAESSSNIKVGNRYLGEWKLEALRKYISVVPQSLDLFQGTIKENILFNSVSNDKEICTRLKDSKILNFIGKLPEGTDTELGKNGNGISMGERQRIALARALYRKPRIYLLDEPTASLDVTAQEEVMEELQKWKKNHIIIIITHRMSVLKCVDEILMLEDGKIFRMGSSDELEAKKEDSWKKILR